MKNFLVNKNKLQLSFVLLVGFNYLQTPVQASQQNDRLQHNVQLASSSIIGNAASVGLVASLLYICNTYLIKEKQLVKSRYPYAQAWYDDLALKYPTANLKQKQFLQIMHGTLPIDLSWCSSFNQIYFPQKSLKDINFLYQSKMNGYTLTEEQQLVLDTEEFILLHEAGHIEHNDIINTLCSIVGTNAALELLGLFYLEATNQDGMHPIVNATMTTKKMIVFWTMLFNIIRSHESNADKFACDLGDLNILKGGISFFESKEVDPLFNIENAQLSPFIETDSVIGNVAQIFVGLPEQLFFTIEKTIGRIYKSTNLTRWIFDCIKDPLHPGPSTRAYAIREEIKDRLKNQESNLETQG